MDPTPPPPRSPVAALLAGARGQGVADRPEQVFVRRPDRRRQAARPSGQERSARAAAADERAARVVAVVVGPITVATAVGAVLVGRSDGFGAPEVLRAVLVLAWVLAGAVLVARHPLARVGVLVVVASCLGALAMLGAAGSRTGWDGVAGGFARGAEHLGPYLVFAATLHVLLVLPRGVLGTPLRRSTARGGAGP